MKLSKQQIPHLCELLGFDGIEAVDGHVTLLAESIIEIEGALAVIVKLKEAEFTPPKKIESPFEQKEEGIFVIEESEFPELRRHLKSHFHDLFPNHVYSLKGVSVEKNGALKITAEAFVELTGIQL